MAEQTFWYEYQRPIQTGPKPKNLTSWWTQASREGFTEVAKRVRKERELLKPPVVPKEHSCDV